MVSRRGHANTTSLPLQSAQALVDYFPFCGSKEIADVPLSYFL
jgi:hypothetical protein